MDNIAIRMRIGFSKTGRLRFLSHLELIALLERIVRRSGLPFAVTQGFSPRMKLAFCLPLPVGHAGENEFFDVWLTSFVETSIAKERLIAASPADLGINSVAYIPSTRESLSAYYTNATYRLDFTVDGAEEQFLPLARILADFREEETISFIRKEKEKVLVFDEVFFREPHLLKSDDPNALMLKLYLRPSDAGSLRPELFFERFAENAKRAGYDIQLVCITREEQFPNL